MLLGSIFPLSEGEERARRWLKGTSMAGVTMWGIGI